MIINLNVTGKESLEKLEEVAGEIQETLMGEISETNILEAQAVLTIYGMISLNMIAMLIVNRAMNAKGGDVIAAHQYSRETILPEYMEQLKKYVAQDFETIVDGKAKEVRFDKEKTNVK